MGRRRVVGAVALILGALVGLGAWLQFGYERTPAPQRITVTAAGPGVAFVLERWPGDPAPASEFSGAGFTVRADGTQVSDRAGASTTYSGPVGSNALLRVERDPDGTPLTVRVGGRRPRSTVGYADMALRRAARSEWDVRGHPATGRQRGVREA